MRRANAIQPHSSDQLAYADEPGAHINWQSVKLFVHGRVQGLNRPLHVHPIIAYLLYWHEVTVRENGVLPYPYTSVRTLRKDWIVRVEQSSYR